MCPLLVIGDGAVFHIRGEGGGGMTSAYSPKRPNPTEGGLLQNERTAATWCTIYRHPMRTTMCDRHGIVTIYVAPTKPTKPTISSKHRASLTQETEKEGRTVDGASKPATYCRRSFIVQQQKHNLPLLLLETGVDDERREVAEVEKTVQLNRPVYLGAEDHNLT